MGEEIIRDNLTSGREDNVKENGSEQKGDGLRKKLSLMTRRRSSVRVEKQGEVLQPGDGRETGEEKKTSGVLSPVGSLRKKLSLKKRRKQREEAAQKK